MGQIANSHLLNMANNQTFHLVSLSGVSQIIYSQLCHPGRNYLPVPVQLLINYPRHIYSFAIYCQMCEVHLKFSAIALFWLMLSPFLHEFAAVLHAPPHTHVGIG